MAAAVLVALALGGACAAPPIQHVVLVELADPTHTEALLADCRAELADIPSLRALHVGTPLDTGRELVDGSYHVGLVLAFDTRADYEAYLVHPRHVALVERWRPRWRSLRVFDID